MLLGLFMAYHADPVLLPDHALLRFKELAGVRFLRNQALRFDSGDGVLAVTGLEDLEEAKDIDLDAAPEGSTATLVAPATASPTLTPEPPFVLSALTP